ncbi:MAG: exopolysaccharide biosynthesis polyprenyl glycosylphosphotransferase [Bacteroidales bacterium]|nr:exopolysaccharide biosynthesis polyprenyl glycosylphosphotransferase [Bacteroidales bacterium]
MGISIVGSLLGVLFVRWQLHPILGFQHYLLVWVLAATICSLVSFLALGTHKIVIRHSTYRSIGNLMLAILMKDGLLGLSLIAQIFHFENASTETFVILSDFFFTLVLMILARVIIISIYENLKADNFGANVDKLPVIVYGTGNKSIAMVDRLYESPNYQIVGFLTSKKEKNGQILRNSKAYFVESLEQLAELKTRLGFEGILFAPDGDIPERQKLIDDCLALGIHILNAPRIDEVKFGNMSRQAIKEINNKSIDYIPDGMTSFERNGKRIIDCIIAFFLLIIFSPLFLLCYILITREDGGPAIYSQERIGRFGRPFNIHKFRSMKLDAESAGPALYSGDDDPRLTKVGKFLRKHHLDELPQLWDVFVGNMAFVGYRPERQYFIDKIMEVDPRYYYLYQIRPGVTSYATLKNGYTDTLDKMVRRLELDLYYLRHRSWWFDLKILFSTFTNIVFGKVF